MLIFDELGFGGCSLVLAVPEAWVDVSSVADLAEVSADFRAAGKDLKVATKFPRLVEQFLLNMGVNYFSLVSTSGALEAAPVMGYADMIADITSSGTHPQGKPAQDGSGWHHPEIPGLPDRKPDLGGRGPRQAFDSAIDDRHD